jgi:hypothetical protein
MEKRWSERKELSVGVDIYQQGELLASCFSKDIGLGGTFLGADSACGVKKESDVELIFRLATSESDTKHKINAKVTRVSDQGLGFKFCNFDTGVFRSLQEIMSYKTDSSSKAH